MSNDALWMAYANTVLRIGGERQVKVDLRQPLSDADRRVLTKLGPKGAFAIITPFDPNGRPASGWKNRWRYIRMRVQLRLRALPFVLADGESPDGSHRERGFAIAVARGEAASIAREWRQLALYWFDGEAFWIDDVRTTRTPQRLP